MAILLRPNGKYKTSNYHSLKDLEEVKFTGTYEQFKKKGKTSAFSYGASVTIIKGTTNHNDPNSWNRESYYPGEGIRVYAKAFELVNVAEPLDILDF